MPLLQIRAADRPRSMIREAVVLAAITLVLALAAWFFRSPRLPLMADMSRYELDLGFSVVPARRALEFYEAGSHIFVDARELPPESRAYIPGAFFIRASSFEDDLGEVLDFIYPEDPLIIYGSEQLQIPGAVADRFVQRGYEVTGILSGGIEAWREAGGPLAGGEGGDD